MNELKLPFSEMISKLDTAGGMMLVASMRDPTIRKAWELVTEVSISLGEWGQDIGYESAIS